MFWCLLESEGSVVHYRRTSTIDRQAGYKTIEVVLLRVKQNVKTKLDMAIVNKIVSLAAIHANWSKNSNATVKQEQYREPACKDLAEEPNGSKTPE